MAPGKASSEPSVALDAAMPKGYCFVRKGNVYVTGNCRKLAKAARKTVFVVLGNSKSKRQATVGIRVPVDIYKQVVAAERTSRGAREDAVRKRDGAAAREFEQGLLRIYPATPHGAIPGIVAHALAKRKKRVARSGKLELDDRVRLAVGAHVRHCHTDYDRRLRDGADRADARRDVAQKIAETLRAWRGGAGKQRPTVAAATARRASLRANNKSTKHGSRVVNGRVVKQKAKSRRPANERTVGKARQRTQGKQPKPVKDPEEEENEGEEDGEGEEGTGAEGGDGEEEKMGDAESGGEDRYVDDDDFIILDDDSSDSDWTPQD